MCLEPMAVVCLQNHHQVAVSRLHLHLVLEFVDLFINLKRVHRCGRGFRRAAASLCLLPSLLVLVCSRLQNHTSQQAQARKRQEVVSEELP